MDMAANNMDFHVRAAQKSDIAALCEAAHTVWHEHYASILTKSQIDYMLNRFQSPDAVLSQLDEGYVYDLLMCGQGIAGYCAYKRAPGYAYLSKLYILAPYRSLGCSHLLLGRVERFAVQNGQDKIRLNVNKFNADSIAAYNALGFTKIADEVNDIGLGFVMDDYVMEKTL